MTENDPNGEARELLADLEHEIEAMWQVLGPHHVRPPMPTAEPVAEAPFAELAAEVPQVEAAIAEPAAATPEPSVAEPSPTPRRPTFEDRLARIAAS